MIVTIRNRIPKGLKWETVEQPSAILDALGEAGLLQYQQQLAKAASERLGQDEMLWEGWYAEDGVTANLYAVGILKHNRVYYTRMIQVYEVPQALRAETEEGIGLMIAEYLDSLLSEIERTVRPGRGRGGWQSKN